MGFEMRGVAVDAVCAAAAAVVVHEWTEKMKEEDEGETWGSIRSPQIDIDNERLVPTRRCITSAEFCRGAYNYFQSLHELANSIGLALRAQLHLKGYHVAPCGSGSC